VLVQPPEHILDSQDKKARFMSSETVTEILDDVVPLSTLGKELNDIHMVSGWNESELIEYENVSVGRSTHNCLPLKPEREMRATVMFKRDTCRSQFNAR
jgi:hypothetical protein